MHVRAGSGFEKAGGGSDGGFSFFWCCYELVHIRAGERRVEGDTGVSLSSERPVT